ncbi:MAG: hypothetical protein H8K04_13975 [Nitrospira sp.]
MKTIWMLQRSLIGGLILSVAGCATELPPLVHQDEVTGSLVVGRVLAVLTGERSRRYMPQVRFLELENQGSLKRFQVEIESPDQRFAVSLPPGMYQLTRVQISEGPFMSMADLSMALSVDAEAITYVGTWRFGVESPRYGRMVAVSVVADQAETARVRDFLDDQYPAFDRRSIVETLPKPSQMEARLYEVMPYPRYSRYFRRHWW